MDLSFFSCENFNASSSWKFQVEKTSWMKITSSNGPNYFV